jgi:hypothetical protein
MEVFMNSRYLTNVALTILGAFTVVASMVWAPSTFMWLMLGSGIVAVLLAGSVAIATRGIWASHPVQRSSRSRV